MLRDLDALVDALVDRVADRAARKVLDGMPAVLAAHAAAQAPALRPLAAILQCSTEAARKRAARDGDLARLAVPVGRRRTLYPVAAVEALLRARAAAAPAGRKLRALDGGKP